MNRQFHITVLGAGSLGSFLGGYLSLNKHNRVSLIGRLPHVDIIKNKGLIVEMPNRTETVSVEAYSSIQELPEKPDLVVLTVRAYQTRSALQDLIARFGKKVPVITFQNGNLLDEISENIGVPNTIGGTTLISAKLLEPGRVRLNGEYPIVIGEISGEITNRILRIQRAFQVENLKVHVAQNIVGEIWAKMIVNSTTNTLTGATNLTIRQVFESAPLRNFSYEMVKESFNVAKVSQVDLENIAPGVAKTYKEMIVSVDAWNAFAQGPQPDIKLSMCALIERGLKTEVDYTNGYILSMARKYGIAAPHHERIVNIIHEIEEGIRKQSPENLF